MGMMGGKVQLLDPLPNRSLNRIGEMRVLIVDDNPEQRAALAQLCQERGNFGDLAIADSGVEALKLIRASPPDMMLLDCELSDMTGFDVLRSLRRDERPMPIMVADDGRHAVEALEFAVIDYLTRPVSAERFDACLRRVRTLSGQFCPEILATHIGAGAQIGARFPAATPLGIGDRLVGERTGRFYFLAPGDVDYIEADSNYMYLQIGNDRYINRDSLKRVAPLLEPLGFIRISRSILLNLRRVAYAEREGRGILAFTLNSGVRLVSSAGYRIVAGANLRVGRRCGPRRFRESS
jgi:two-component system LytT family response regulator